MSITLSVVPRTNNMNETCWLFKTRRYISKYDAFESYKLIHGKQPEGLPTAKDLAKVFEIDEDKEARITVEVVSYEFEPACVEQYLKNDLTRSFGIALAIEFRMLKEIVGIADKFDIFLYLEEHSLSTAELSVIIKSGIMHDLSKRIIDKNKVMYTTLIDNFTKLLKIDDCGVINESFVTRYIEHASFYNDNPLLVYILDEFPSSHPIFEGLDCLAWDPFTKSRRFSHWLKVSNRMDELAKYYLNIKSEAENINANKKYIDNYLKFKAIYADS